MIHYNPFNTTDNHSYNVYHAINYCRKHQEDCLVFDKGVYHFYADMASEEVLHVSNHDIYGIQRIAFLLKDMNQFTIDGGGSTFIFHDSMMPFAVLQSQNITLKNFSIDYDETMTLDVKVTDAEKDYFDFEAVNNDKYYIKGNMLYLCDTAGNDDIYHFMLIRSMENDKRFLPQSKDAFRKFNPDIWFEDLGNNKIRVHNPDFEVHPGMHLIIKSNLRFSCNIFVEGCKNIFVNNITMYKSYGMGLLAQKTENIFVDNMTVKASKDSLFSLNCDGTHFVHCKGVVKVTNSSFSEQQDDALNVHGIFTKIVDKTKEYIVVKYMHPSAKGINVYEKDSAIATLNPKTLIPNGIYIISDVEIINMNYTKIYVQGGTEEINIGDVVEDLTWSCDLIFENNHVFNNRARGMLIAAKGKVQIRDNYFNTPGVAILFESDGQYWFESGGTTDVCIENNTFDHCRYSVGWGNHVIEVKPREEFHEGEYYHKKISITKNHFVNNDSCLLYADNIGHVIFKDNLLENQISDSLVEFVNCGSIECDIN